MKMRHLAGYNKAVGHARRHPELPLIRFCIKQTVQCFLNALAHDFGHMRPQFLLINLNNRNFPFLTLADNFRL